MREDPHQMTNRTLQARMVGVFLTISLLTFTLAGCGGSSAGPGNSETRILGAGATFPYPLYQKWFSEYNKAHANVKFDYQSLGSGAGIKQITEKTIDFGGSDAPMKDDDLSKVQGQILHIPTVLGAVVITYNLPGVTTELKLTPEAIAGIFLGNVKKWNDPAIASTNEGVSLPANDITVVLHGLSLKSE
jgi:phosphate transport system substrate-binding protein